MTDAVLAAAPDTPEVGTVSARPSQTGSVTDARVASYVRSSSARVSVASPAGSVRFGAARSSDSRGSDSRREG